MPASPRAPRQSPLRAAALAGALAALAPLLTAPAAAWSPETQKALASEAARLAPPDLARVLERHAREFLRGAVEPFEEGDALRHVQNEDGTGALVATFLGETRAAVEALRAFRPMAEVAGRLGRIVHWMGDLGQPLNASASDPLEGRYLRDFALYVDTARPRFAVVLYENAAVVTTDGDLERLAERALARGRALYPSIGREYRRIGFGNGRALFDDRSSAFGVAALAYSHAVSDAARVLRYVWIAAGGADPRPILDRPRARVLTLDPAP
jgi:hypothetical protein